GGGGHDRVGDGAGPRGITGVEYKEPKGQPDLRSRQAHPRRRVHRFEHVVVELAQELVEGLDVAAGRSEDGITERSDRDEVAAPLLHVTAIAFRHLCSPGDAIARPLDQTCGSASTRVTFPWTASRRTSSLNRESNSAATATKHTVPPSRGAVSMVPAPAYCMTSLRPCAPLTRR